MYILKYMKNSDDRCDSSVEIFPTLKDAQQKMAYDFTQTLLKLDIDLVSFHPSDSKYASVSGSGAMVHIDIDHYSWEIIDDPNYVYTPNTWMFACAVRDSKTGELSIGQSFWPDYPSAQKEMRKQYDAMLKDLELSDNNSCNEDGESVPGGYFDGSQAVIYAHVDYCMGQLLEKAVFVIRPAAKGKKQ